MALVELSKDSTASKFIEDINHNIGEVGKSVSVSTDTPADDLVDALDDVFSGVSGVDGLSASDNAADFVDALNVNFGKAGVGYEEIVVDKDTQGAEILTNKLITVDNNEVVLKSNTSFDVVKCPIAGCKTLEGVGFSTSSEDKAAVWAVLDLHDEVIDYIPYKVYNSYTTQFRHLPNGAAYLLFNQKKTGSTFLSKYYLRKQLPQREYNILALGNSFTCCYWQYVPAILEHLFGGAVQFNIIVGYIGGGTFPTWKGWLYGNATAINAMYYTVHGEWKTGTEPSAATLFGSRDFDLVGFQARSNDSTNYDGGGVAWKTIWPDVVDKVSELSQGKADLMWTMVHSKPSSADVADSDAIMRSIFTAHQEFENDFTIDICPVGTAIQNARHTSINNLSWDGSYGQLTPDNQHLQRGFACFIAGWAIARFVCEKLGISTEPCVGDTMSIDAAFDATYSKMVEFGTNYIYATGASMNRIAQECVEAALQSPYEINTNIETNSVQ